MAKSYLTKRDIQLLECLDRYSLMTSLQIKESLFQSTDLRTVLRRLRTLEKRKFIQRHHGLEKGKLVWTVSQKGLAAIGSEAAITINRNSLEHDVSLTNVRLLLDQLNIGKKWSGYHELRLAASTGSKPEDRSADVIPDALFGAVQNGEAKFIALELELTAKSRKRYRRILDLYSYKKSIDHVWYVLKPPKLGLQLHLQLDKIQKSMPSNWIAWTLLDDLIANHLEARVHFKNGKSQTLKDFVPPNKIIKPQKYPPTPTPTV